MQTDYPFLAQLKNAKFAAKLKLVGLQVL